MTARWQAMTKTFIAPTLVAEGTVFDWDGPPGPHLLPLNEEAETALALYYEKNPGARLNPVEDLPMTTGIEIVSTPTTADAVADLSAMDPNKKAEPGLTDGGKAVDKK